MISDMVVDSCGVIKEVEGWKGELEFEGEGGGN